jgi:hypothetical protein
VSAELWERLQAMAKGYPSTISHAQALEAVQWAAEEIRRLRRLAGLLASNYYEDAADYLIDGRMICPACLGTKDIDPDLAQFDHAPDCLIFQGWKAAEANGGRWVNRLPSSVEEAPE